MNRFCRCSNNKHDKRMKSATKVLITKMIWNTIRWPWWRFRKHYLTRVICEICRWVVWSGWPSRNNRWRRCGNGSRRWGDDEETMNTSNKWNSWQRRWMTTLTTTSFFLCSRLTYVHIVSIARCSWVFFLQVYLDTHSRPYPPHPWGKPSDDGPSRRQ